MKKESFKNTTVNKPVMPVTHELTYGLATGSIVETNVSNRAGVLYIRIPKAIIPYLDVVNTDKLVIVCEHSAKYGNYIGVGKPKKVKA